MKPQKKKLIMSAKKMTYSQALEEINEIILEIDSGEVDIDELSDKLKKAKKLFEFLPKKTENHPSFH